MESNSKKKMIMKTAAEDKTCINDWNEYHKNSSPEERVFFQLLMSEFNKTLVEVPISWRKEASINNRINAINIFFN